ncbi:MAG TPA: hypothetical protein VMW47_02475 [Verrucomicrobiae bacterium]|nr:hypothetical protein [Verrucomicrobiae bacterium]
MRRRPVDQTAYYRGVRMAPYDLVRELALALAAVLVLVLVLAAALSSPDVPAVTVQSWAQHAPVDLVSTATSELQGTTLSSAYGPPYTAPGEEAADAVGITPEEVPDSVQTLGPLAPQLWAGIHLPIHPAWSDVLHPLVLASVGNPALRQAVVAYRRAPAATRRRWLVAFQAQLGSARMVRGQLVVRPAQDGPLPLMMETLLTVARSGGLDALLTQSGHFYQTDYTGPLLFLGDGGYLPALAQSQHLLGDQWGMMNETGRYPGQAWLWLYTMWYQIPPYSTAGNADLLVVLTMGLLTTLLLLVPFLPGLRDIPRWVPIYRLIWREHYRDEAARRRPRPGPG